MRIENLMHAGDSIPRVTLDTLMPDVIHTITSKRLGMTCVVDAAGRLAGIVTDGDLRRHMAKTPNLLGRTAADVMSTSPVTIGRTALAAEAIRKMEERKITSLAVVNGSNEIEGVVHLHDLWPTDMSSTSRGRP
jgi:arabinose-5-phosphate isomerase